ncbi:acyl--CoA ligase, partial [Actinomadura sp. CNU-125]|uniref:acyl--CoA ligase n=1 Tax=Actinomadura sp. CNU-125 TaxID=1904961 RepID=UPI0011782D8F
MPATDREPSLDAGSVAALLARAVDLDARRPVHALGLDDTLDDLAKLGLAPGDAIIVALSNSTRTVRVYLAALLLGLVPLAIAPGTP